MQTTTTHKTLHYGACTMRVKITRVRAINEQVLRAELQRKGSNERG